MKCTALFLVLSLVVLMAEPGDAIFHHIFKGIVHVGKTIHRLVTGGQNMKDQQKLEQRSFDQERAAFD
uniref:Moronecidin n=1 Tax=Siniperca chuatsi TaxID=119488 RepID=Q2VWH5_SINCH|nr:moronecidin [Siniperca chuatsi]